MKEKDILDSDLREVFILLSSGAVSGGLVQMDFDSDKSADRSLDVFTLCWIFSRRERKEAICPQVVFDISD